nr:probable palmitoyltransferase ZDHHC12 isoform X2 [Camelus dromedarius]
MIPMPCLSQDTPGAHQIRRLTLAPIAPDPGTLPVLPRIYSQEDQVDEVLASLPPPWPQAAQVQAPHSQEEAKEEQTAMVPQAIPLRRCRFCMVLQPLRARHCRECRRCVRRYDHHCPWMENCVGERNHPLFVAYLALQLVVLLWGLYLAWSGLHFFQPWGLWLRSSGLLFATFLLLSLFSLVAGLLLASHLYLVASNTTTWEFMSSHRIAYLRQRPGNPFDRGLTRNVAHFFCGWPSGSWETLWVEEEEKEGRSQAV